MACCKTQKERESLEPRKEGGSTLGRGKSRTKKRGVSPCDEEKREVVFYKKGGRNPIAHEGRRGSWWGKERGHAQQGIVKVEEEKRGELAWEMGGKGGQFTLLGEGLGGGYVNHKKGNPRGRLKKNRNLLSIVLIKGRPIYCRTQGTNTYSKEAEEGKHPLLFCAGGGTGEKRPLRKQRGREKEVSFLLKKREGEQSLFE